MRRPTRTLLMGMTVFAWSSCMRPPPPTNYYTLALPVQVGPAVPRASLSIAEIEADAAYTEERIAYRTSPYRLNYYEYHRWSSTLPTYFTDYLRAALMRTGYFDRIDRHRFDDSLATLTGRIMAFEEVDRGESLWFGRVEIELSLEDSVTRTVVWSRRFREEERLAERSPEGLAHGLSLVMGRIVVQVAPEIAAAAASVSP